MTPPVAFISYAWESEALKAWVKELARRLRHDGVHALLDQWETAPGDQLTRYMEDGLERANFVLIVCTPAYRERSARPAGGVAYEGSVMTAELVTGGSRRKFVPLLRGHEWPPSAPPWLLGSFYVDFRGEPYNENAYLELLDTLLDRREKAPPIGQLDEHPAPPRSIALPETASMTDLTDLAGDTWPYVWKQLRDLEPYDPELLEEGRRWILSNPSDDAWTFVWEDLVRADPYSPELVAIGRHWLISHVGHSSWAFLWRRLIELDPDSPELRALGKQHLRETR
jgi:hypothetical protein